MQEEDCWEAPQTPVQTPPAPWNAHCQVFSVDPSILTPATSWSPNFATPHTPLQSFSTYHTSHSLLKSTTSRSQKRKHLQDENLPAFLSLAQNLSLPKKQKSPSSLQQKIAIVLSVIRNDASWSFSEFLFHVFQDKDEYG